MRDAGAADIVHPLAAPFRIDGRNGEAFVLVHGFAGNAAHFRDLGGHLAARGYTVNVPLLPGHGRAVSDLGRFRRSDWIEATLDAVREVGDHTRVHLVGLSMGGLLGLVAATRIRLATLTTINSPVVFRDRRIRFTRVWRHVQPERRWQAEPVPDLDADVADHWIHLDGFPLIAAAELFSLSRHALSRARDVECPVLIVQSRADTTTHPRSARVLQRALGSRSHVVWLEHSMHNALFDRERHVIRHALLDFVGER